MYLYGREFAMITDNRPLSRIFYHNNNTPGLTSGRLLRYTSLQQEFNYKIEHRKADDIVNVDCLTRAPTKETTNFEHFIDEEVRIFQEQIVNPISTYSVTAITIANETDRDEKLSKLKKDLVNEDYADPDYSIQNGLILKANRVVIPAEILNELHHTHIGIVKMKQLARKYCYWRAIDSDIEQIVRSCSSCAKIRNSPPRVPVQKTITLLQEIFFTHGLPQKFIAPGHPATNGLAERYVQILKRKLKAMEEDNSPLNIKVQEILLRYRATPLANGKTPIQLYLGRDLKIKLDAIRPIQHQKTTVSLPVVRQFSVGDRVQVRWYGKNKLLWQYGTIKTKFGQLHYQLALESGYVLKRHIN